MNQTITVNRQEYIVFDDAFVSGVGAELFEPKKDSGDLQGVAVNTFGRGSVYMFQHQGVDLVLRRYRRGGMIRHFIESTYWFGSLKNTRMWQEFNLLQCMKSLGLPVPTAIAARCVKTTGFTCCGDLITQKVLNSKTVAELLQEAPMSDELWAVLGRVIARFHLHNIYHADLNANNILVTAEGEFYLIDFDRGELRDNPSRQAWQQSNLNRLLRSFLKLSKKHPSFHFTDAHWQILLKAYCSAKID